jgi:SNF2 family DNA or RNA helicase
MGQIIHKPSEAFPSSRLRDYQQEQARRIANGESRALFWEMGSGKTAATLHGLAWQGQAPGLNILISTGTVVRGVWGPEIQDWEDTQGIHYLPILGTPAQREKLLRVALDRSLREKLLIATTFDTAGWLAEKLHAQRFNLLIVDEISMARNVSTARFKSCFQLSARSAQRVVLTGSPTPNNISDLFGPIGIADHGKSLGTNYGTFRQNFMIKVGPKAWQVAEKPGARNQVLDRIKHLVHVVRTQDVVDGMPTFHRRMLNVELPMDALLRYREVESGLLNGNEIHEDSILVRLQQIANGSLIEPSGEIRRIHGAKYDAAADLIDELLAADQQVIVVYQFKADAEAILKKWPKEAVLFDPAQTAELIARWNSGTLKILVMNSRSAGHGLNLQHAPQGGHMIWISGTWSSELYEQTVARLYRPGQKRPVNVVLIAAEGTVDGIVLGILGRKISAQEVVKLYLREKRAEMKPETRDLAALIRAARLEVGRCHPDRGGTEESFRAAWARFKELQSQLE